MPVRPRAVAVLGIAVAALAGCTAAESAEPPKKPAGRAAPAASAEVRNLTVPIDAYATRKVDDYLVAAAEDVLMRDCLDAEGLDWTPRRPVREADVDPPNRRRYGVMEPAVARAFGFKPPPLPAEEARFTEERIERIRSLGQRGAEIAYGVDGAGGCWKKANTTLLKGVPRESDYDVINRDTREGYEESQRAPEVRKVHRAWSACMKKAGFRYGDPMEAMADPRWRKSETASAKEIAAAEADVRCKRETDLVKIWSAAEAKIQQRLIKASADDYRALKATRDAHLAAARRALEAAPKS